MEWQEWLWLQTDLTACSQPQTVSKTDRVETGENFGMAWDTLFTIPFTSFIGVLRCNDTPLLYTPCLRTYMPICQHPILMCFLCLFYFPLGTENGALLLNNFHKTCIFMQVCLPGLCEGLLGEHFSPCLRQLCHQPSPESFSLDVSVNLHLKCTKHCWSQNRKSFCCFSPSFCETCSHPNTHTENTYPHMCTSTYQ